MTMQDELNAVAKALKLAGARVGWDSYPAQTQVFMVGECRVAVVPLVRWAMRAQEKAARARLRQAM